MPYPGWLARINRRFFNPGQVRKGKYPVVTHVGRSSGKTYQTPMDAHPTRTGWVLVIRYGPESDWVRNILAAGEATLRVQGEDHRLAAPRLVGLAEAQASLPDGYDRGKDFDKAADFLLLDTAP